MRIAEQTPERMVLEDESGKMGLGGWIGLLVFCLFLVLLGTYSGGYLPNTDPWRNSRLTGEHASFAVFLCGIPALVLIVVGVFRSYSRVLLDKQRDQFVVEKRSLFRTSSREWPLKSVESVLVNQTATTWRMEFKLLSGEVVTPRRLLNNYYLLDDMTDTAQRVETFLSKTK